MGKLVCAVFLAAVVMQANAWSVFHPIDGIESLFRDVRSYVRDVNQWFRDGIIDRISHIGDWISNVKSRVADLGKNVISHVVNIFHWPHFGRKDSECGRLSIRTCKSTRVPRYYYDHATQECQRLNYIDCNHVKGFSTIEECERKCKSS